jgi:hypothetical protein
MPLFIGGILAIVGIGGGVAMFFIQRAEVVPLREKAEAAAKRADEADLKLKTAEAVASAAESNAAKAKEAAASAETALKDARTKSSAAEKQVSSLKAQIKALEEGKPMMPEAPMAGKGDTPDPKGAEPKGDAGPKGGKHWSALPSVPYETLTHKAGDRLWLWPKEDVILKADGDKLKIRFRFQLQKGKEMPASMVATILVTRGIFTDGITLSNFTLKGDNGDSEVVIPIKGLSGMAKISFFLSDSTNPGSDKLKIYSTILAMDAELGKEKE